MTHSLSSTCPEKSFHPYSFIHLRLPVCLSSALPASSRPEASSLVSPPASVSYINPAANVFVFVFSSFCLRLRLYLCLFTFPPAPSTSLYLYIYISIHLTLLSLSPPRYLSLSINLFLSLFRSLSPSLSPSLSVFIQPSPEVQVFSDSSPGKILSDFPFACAGPRELWFPKWTAAREPGLIEKTQVWRCFVEETVAVSLGCV